MKLVKPSFDIWNQGYDLDSIYKHVERCGRVCYKSEDRITEDSAKGFVERMIKSGHGAMLEHGTVYLKMEGVFLNPKDCAVAYGNYVVDRYIGNPYSRVTIKHDSDWKANVYIATNYRVLVENNYLADLRYLCEPTEHHEKRVTVRFVCDRGVSHEFVRHRVFSFAQESTRYCNYFKDKFGNELTFIKPCWFGSSLVDDTGHWDANTFYRMPNQPIDESAFLGTLQSVERAYFDLLKCGWKPQEARAVLPNALKTELVMTGFIDDWKHFFELRCDKAAHPQARELAIPLRKTFIEKRWI